MSGFDFDAVAPWEVGESVLPPGSHVVSIESATDGGGKSSGGYEQIELELQNDEGRIKDWLIYNDSGGYGIQKIVALSLAAHGSKPEATDADIEDGKPVMKAAWIKKLVGKKVGIVVRMEPSNKGDGKSYARVQGYRPADQINNGAARATASATASGVSDEDIPF